MICNINGQFIGPDQPCISAANGAYLFGDTLFETMKAHSGSIRFLDEHLARLGNSAALLDIPFPEKGIRAALADTVANAGAGTFRVRLTLGRGNFEGLGFPPPTGGEYIIQAGHARLPTREQLSEGIACVQAPNGRVNPLSHLPQMKRGNYADCLYAANHARREGADEALFISNNGYLLEGATSNVFLVIQETLVTPAIGRKVLPGIIRDQVIRLASEWGMRMEVRTVMWDELFSADEAFITNSLIDVLPIARVDGRPLRRGPLGARFYEALQ